MKLGSARTRNITKTHMNTNFTIMEDTETENYLGDIIGNVVTEEETYEKAIRGIETLGAKWLKENIGIKGRTIVANTLLQAKLAHRASVNGASKKMQNIIRKKIKEFIWGGENKKARVIWEIMLKHPKEGGTGIRDPIIAIESRRISILKKIITRDRQPWMRYIERKMTKIAKKWKVREAMGAKPSKNEQKELDDTCITESAIKIWIEIGGTKRIERLVEGKKDEEVRMKWESGFGVEKSDTWIPIERLKSKTVYELLIDKRNRIKKYTPNPAHAILHNIDRFLTPEERNYWWKLNHKIVSTKQTESKFKRDEAGKLVSNRCPICKVHKETKQHYNNECSKIIEYRHRIAEIIEHKEITDKEWNLEISTKNIYSDIYIAKARWVFHCERCNVDHRRRKRVNITIILNRTKKRMKAAQKIMEKITVEINTQEQNKQQEELTRQNK